LDDFPYALTVYDGHLIAGGAFSTAGGVSANRIARWDGSAWQPLDSGMNDNTVFALTVYNGELIAGGSFTTAGNVVVKFISRWDGSVWHSLGGGMNNEVFVLAVYDVGITGQLVAGGAFTTADDQVSVGWARFGPICSPGDLDEDGVVGPLDFQALLGDWGACPEPCAPSCAADLDGDCNVGITDFLTLLQNWG
jgi:hypothetical protein